MDPETTETTTEEVVTGEAEVETEANAEEVSAAAEDKASAATADESISEPSVETAPEGDKPGKEQAKSLFAQMYDEEFSKPKEVKAEELPSDVKPGSRAADEIIRLRQRAQRAEGEIGNFQTAMQQHDGEVAQYVQQLNTQMQTIAQQNAELRGRLDEITRRSPTNTPQGEESPYVNSLMKRFGDEVVSPQLKPFADENKQLRERLDKFEKAQSSQAEKADIQRRADTLRQQASALHFDVIMRGVPKEEAQELSTLGTTMTLAMMRANPQVDMREAAVMVRRFLLNGADKISRSVKQTTAVALKKKEEAPNTVNRAGVGGKVKEPLPDMDLLIANGWQTPYLWMEAGRPKLKPLPANRS